MQRLVHGMLPPGSHNRVWDGRDTAGNRVAAGTYLLDFRNGVEHVVTKLTVVR